MRLEQDEIVVRYIKDEEEDDDMLLRMLRFLGKDEEADNVKKIRLVPASQQNL